MVTAQLLHFAVLTIAYANSADGVIITVTTNNPCHLWLRISDHMPQKHLHAAASRGALVQTYIDQCFVAYTDIEQTEPGDTLVHTFEVTPWATCNTKWFYFWGTVAGDSSPSASPLFVYHRKGPSPPPFIWVILINEPWTAPTGPDGWTLLFWEWWTH